MQHGKNIYFTCVVVTLALLGHQTSHSQNKFFFPSCTMYYYKQMKINVFSYPLFLFKYFDSFYAKDLSCIFSQNQPFISYIFLNLRKSENFQFSNSNCKKSTFSFYFYLRNLVINKFRKKQN